MVWVEQFLVKYPELAVFLAISIGYLVGSVKFGGFGLGPVTGSLFGGILIGQFAHVPVSAMAKSFLFLLFLFGIGYSVGPQFLQALRRDGIKPVLLAIVVCVTGLLTAIMVAKILGLDPGFAAGLLFRFADRKSGHGHGDGGYQRSAVTGCRPGQVCRPYRGC